MISSTPSRSLALIAFGLAMATPALAGASPEQFAQAAPVQQAPLPPLAAAPAPAVAPAPTPAVSTPAAPVAAAAAPDPAMDERIRALQGQLAITTDQLPQWTAFAQTMRDNARSTDQLFRQRASAAASMNALQNMQSYAVTARQYADNTQALATAFEALYGGLSPEQKQKADALFRQQATQNAASRPAR